MLEKPNIQPEQARILDILCDQIAEKIYPLLVDRLMKDITDDIRWGQIGKTIKEEINH